MSDVDPLAGPILSKEQTVWVLIIVSWFCIGVLTVLSGQSILGVAWTFLSIGAVYRIFELG